jgi:hypothetical protein
MKAKDTVIVVLLLALAVLSYLLGYNNGKRREWEMRSAQGRLYSTLKLLEDAQKGDLTKVQERLHFMILGQVEAYEKEFGAPPIGDRFTQRFAEARSIARRFESQLVPLTLEDINAPATNAPRK